MSQINNFLSASFVKSRELESLVGRLDHASFVIPLRRHFLNRMKHLFTSGKHVKLVSLAEEVLADLCLWAVLLGKPRDGVSLSLIVERQPDSVIITESCEYCVGSFSVKSGRDFRYETPAHLCFKVPNNILEFLAEVVAIWLGFFDGEVTQGSCVFAGTGSTSAGGWARKSCFADKSQDSHAKASCQLATLAMGNGFCICLQHFSGWMSAVVECLSRNFHLDGNFLARLILFFCPNQLPLLFESPRFLQRLCPLSLAPWKHRSFYLKGGSSGSEVRSRLVSLPSTC